MNTLSKIMLGTITVYALGGCASTDSKSVEPTSKSVKELADQTADEVANEETPELSKATKEVIYVQVLREEYPNQFTGVSDSEVASMGTMLCQTLESGVSSEAIFDVIIESYGPDQNFAGFLYGASTAAFCPAYNM